MTQLTKLMLEKQGVPEEPIKYHSKMDAQINNLTRLIDELKVEVNISSSQDFVIVGVRDYGVGISKEHQSKIFDRFYRVSGAKGRISPGLGMGLYISSEIIKCHGGDIRVSSGEGKGSIFSVSLPLLSDR